MYVYSVKYSYIGTSGICAFPCKSTTYACCTFHRCLHGAKKAVKRTQKYAFAGATCHCSAEAPAPVASRSHRAAQHVMNAAHGATVQRSGSLSDYCAPRIAERAVHLRHTLPVLSDSPTADSPFTRHLAHLAVLLHRPHDDGVQFHALLHEKSPHSGGLALTNPCTLKPRHMGSWPA